MINNKMKFFFFFSLLPLTILAKYDGDPICWADGVPKEYCCNTDLYGQAGTPSCWVQGYTYSMCCGVKDKEKYNPSSSTSNSLRPVQLSLNTCDYIIVGAGSGGATVASRLESSFRVCIIEITDDENDTWSEKYPVGEGLTTSSSNDNNNKVDWKYAFGKGIGGSTLVNSGVYTRGDLSDYEEWGGEENWSRDITRELFKSIEYPEIVNGISDGNSTSSSESDSSFYKYHPKSIHYEIMSRGNKAEKKKSSDSQVPSIIGSVDSPGEGFAPTFAGSYYSDTLATSKDNTYYTAPRSRVSLVSAQKNELPSLMRRLIEKWEASGLGKWRLDPHNGGESGSESEGSDDMTGSISGAWRFAGCSNEMDAACSPQRVPRWRYIGHEREHQSVDKLLKKPKIYLGRVSRVLFMEGQDDLKVSGVEFYDKHGSLFHLHANKEVILAAGVVNTPKILMLSGVGDPLELNELQIPVKKSLPHVGLHLQDHYGFSIVMHSKLNCPKEAHRDENGKPKGGTHLGYLNDFLGQFYAFFRGPKESNSDHLKFEMFLIEGCVDEKYTLTFTILLVSPSNQGRIILDSADPNKSARMEIHPKSHDEDISYLAQALHMIYTKIFMGGGGGVSLRDEFDISVNPPIELISDGEKAKQWVRENLYFYSHPTGTVRLDVNNMGESVLEKDLTVQGIPNLRICDASVFGKVVAGHTDGPTRMIGANCARMILQKERAIIPFSGYGTNTGLKAFHVQYYLNAGGRLIDTADSYENAKVITQGMGQSDVYREDVFLVTKIGPEKFDDVYNAVVEHLNEFKAVTKKGVEVDVGGYFDLVLLHWPHLYDKEKQKVPKCALKSHGGSWEKCRKLAWQGLENVVKDNKARFIGVSNFAIEHLQPLFEWPERKFPIYANQIEYHPFITETWEKTKIWCQDRGIRVMSYGAIGGLKNAMLREYGMIKELAGDGAIVSSESESRDGGPTTDSSFKSYLHHQFHTNYPINATHSIPITQENLMFQWGLNQGVTVLQGSKRKRHMDHFLMLKPGKVGGIMNELFGNGVVEKEFRDKVYQPDSSEYGGESDSEGEGGRVEL